MKDEFYIGYDPDMPPTLARQTRRIAIGLVVFACGVAASLVVAQKRFADGRFEFGNARAYSGRIIERPYPQLVSDGPETSRHWLVGPGKRGAAPIVSGLDGRSVRVTGTLIERDGVSMLEIESGSVQVMAASSSATMSLRAVSAGEWIGEIVDSKCHLGVMKPGDGPVHRDCAVRCLLGGVPPMLVTREGGVARRLPLVSPRGGPLDLDLEPWVARRVRVRAVRFEGAGGPYLGVALDGLARHR